MSSFAMALVDIDRVFLPGPWGIEAHVRINASYLQMKFDLSYVRESYREQKR